MKKTLLMLLAICLFAGCDKGNEGENSKNIEVTGGSTTQTVFAGDTEGQSSVKFVTTGAWRSSIVATTKFADKSWVSIDPASGSDARAYTINIRLIPNYTGADRKAEISIECGESTLLISVEQKSKNEDGTTPEENIIEYDPSPLFNTVYADDDDIYNPFEFTALQSWTTRITDILSDSDMKPESTWIRLNKRSGEAGKGSFKITFDCNYTGDRKAKIEITSGNCIFPIIVEQKGSTVEGLIPDDPKSGGRITAITEIPYYGGTATTYKYFYSYDMTKIRCRNDGEAGGYQDWIYTNKDNTVLLSNNGKVYEKYVINKYQIEAVYDEQRKFQSHAIEYNGAYVSKINTVSATTKAANRAKSTVTYNWGDDLNIERVVEDYFQDPNDNDSYTKVNTRTSVIESTLDPNNSTIDMVALIVGKYSPKQLFVMDVNMGSRPKHLVKKITTTNTNAEWGNDEARYRYEFSENEFVSKVYVTEGSKGEYLKYSIQY